MTKNKLEALIAGTIPLTEFLFYKNNAPNTTAGRILREQTAPIINNPDITPFVGNFPESFAVPLASGFIGDYLAKQGVNRRSHTLEKVGRYFPEIATLAITAYFTLGETILPQILPGTADARDLPAVFISAIAGYSLAKIGRTSGFNEKVYEKIKMD